MKRDVEKIASGTLDVLVVGGGIHGAAIVYHVAKEGYRTAIVLDCSAADHGLLLAATLAPSCRCRLPKAPCPTGDYVGLAHCCRNSASGPL